MKIVAISDTHSLHELVKIPKCDILIHAGDFTGNGSLEHCECFAEWFKKQPAKYKVCIAGNHDSCAAKEHDYVADIFLDNNIVYLENRFANIEGIKIYGSPMTPRFLNWYFMYERGTGKKYWNMIPKDTDILVSHGPAYGKLDLIDDNRVKHNVGCQELGEAIKKLPALKYHICGHIHSGYGSIDSKYYNASVCNEDYEVVNKRLIIKI